MSVYRAPPQRVLRAVRLDSMTAIYDRRSNQTHVVADVVPMILDALSDDEADLMALAERLGTVEHTALAERLDELVGIGLIARA